MTDAAASADPLEPKSYTMVAIVLHWLIAVLLVSMIVYGWWMEALRANISSFEDFQATKAAFNWHKTAGIAILLLSAARLGWRFTHPVPALPNGMAWYERIGARISHIGFYVLMIGMPIGGYVNASAYGAEQPILLFNALELPKIPVPQTEGFQSATSALHSAGGWAILALLALHAGAALKHHFVNRDDVLTRMIPFLKR